MTLPRTPGSSLRFFCGAALNRLSRGALYNGPQFSAAEGEDFFGRHEKLA